MISSGRFGPQYLFTKPNFLLWMENSRPQRYKEYLDHLEVGDYAMWLLYLWSDGDNHIDVGAMGACGVPIHDRRVYFRTALTALVDDVSFDHVDFSDDSSPVYTPSPEDGQLKLSALLGLVDSFPDVLYIGSGGDDVIKRRFAASHTLTCVDICEAIPGTLASYPVSGRIVVSDAYYEGFAYDQLRLASSDGYVSKQQPVTRGDSFLVLPGHSESRWTNLPQFKGFVVDLLARAARGTNRDQIVVDTLSNFGVPMKYFSVERNMLSRVLHIEVDAPEAVLVPFVEFALCLPFESVRAPTVFVKGEVVSRFRRCGPDPNFIQACKLLLEYRDAVRERKRKEKKDKKKKSGSRAKALDEKFSVADEWSKSAWYPELNWAIIRGFATRPEYQGNTDELRAEYISKITSYGTRDIVSALKAVDSSLVVLTTPIDVKKTTTPVILDRLLSTHKLRLDDLPKGKYGLIDFDTCRYQRQYLDFCEKIDVRHATLCFVPASLPKFEKWGECPIRGLVWATFEVG